MGHLVKVASTLNGTHIIVLTSKGFALVYKVLPQDDLMEVLVYSHAVASGPGEGLGIRELFLDKVALVSTGLEGVFAALGMSNIFVLVGGCSISLVAIDTNFTTKVVSKEALGISEQDSIASASASPALNRVCIVLASGSVKILDFTAFSREPESTSVQESSTTSIGTYDQAVSGMNARHARVTVVGESQVLHCSLAGFNKEERSHKLGSRPVLCSWTPAGRDLLVACENGWQITSSLGAVYCHGLSQMRKVDWSLGGDSLYYLDQDNALYTVDTARVITPPNSSLPVIYGSGRVTLFHINESATIPPCPWLNCSLPAAFLSKSWPPLVAASSTDGKYVAVAGSNGLEMLRVGTRQWKQVLTSSELVRGGLCFHNQRLYVAMQYIEGSIEIRAYSAQREVFTVDSGEPQPLATQSVVSQVCCMTAADQRLYVLLMSGTLHVYLLERDALSLVESLSLVGVVNPLQTRAMGVLEGNRYLFLVEESLVAVYSAEANKFTRHAIGSAEWFQLYGDDLWVFDGEKIHIYDATQDEFTQKVEFAAEGGVVGASVARGLVLSVEAEEVHSFDTSFNHLVLQPHVSVCIAHLLEAALAGGNASAVVSEYSDFEYFGGALEVVLFRALTLGSLPLDEVVRLVKDVEGWPAIVASCARKVETKYWPRLFEAVGHAPQALFDEALANHKLDTAVGYLMVLQSRGEAVPTDARTVRLFKAAFAAHEFDICRQLGRFLHRVDSSGGVAAEFRELCI